MFQQLVLKTRQLLVNKGGRDRTAQGIGARSPRSFAASPSHRQHPWLLGSTTYPHRTRGLPTPLASAYSSNLASFPALYLRFLRASPQRSVYNTSSFSSPSSWYNSSLALQITAQAALLEPCEIHYLPLSQLHSSISCKSPATLWAAQ